MASLDILFDFWCGHPRESRDVYKILAARPEGKRPLERPRHRWEDNIKMGLENIGY
jgi:hypothetical protein